MKTKLLTAAAVAALSVSANAQVYAGASLGLSSTHAASGVSFQKPSSSLSGHYGMKNRNLRVEFEGKYHEAGVKEGSRAVKTYSALTNVFYDLDEAEGAVKPYVGAGVGFIKFKHDEGEAKNLYQAIAGLRYELNGSMDIFVDYRYQETFKRIFGDDRYKNSSVAVGLVKYL